MKPNPKNQEVIDILKDKLGDRPFTEEDLEGLMPLWLLKQYGLVEDRLVVVEEFKMTQEEVAEELNDCCGDYEYFEEKYGDWPQLRYVVKDGAIYKQKCDYRLFFK